MPRSQAHSTTPVSVVLGPEPGAPCNLSTVPPPESHLQSKSGRDVFVVCSGRQSVCLSADLCNVGVQTTEGIDCPPPSLSALLGGGKGSRFSGSLTANKY